MTATPEPYRVEIPDATLVDLRARLALTRWPDEIAGSGWRYGTNLDFMRRLVAYWSDEFDWRAQEARINELAHFRLPLDGIDLHFVHQPGRGPDPTPLLLVHGW